MSSLFKEFESGRTDFGDVEFETFTTNNTRTVNITTTTVENDEGSGRRLLTTRTVTRTSGTGAPPPGMFVSRFQRDMLRPVEDAEPESPPEEPPVPPPEEAPEEVEAPPPAVPAQDIINGHLLPLGVRKKIDNTNTGVGLNEVSPGYKDEDTFVVIGRGSGILYRFGDATNSHAKSGGGWQHQAISILTHGMFNYFMVFVVLLNCVAMLFAAIPTLPPASSGISKRSADTDAGGSPKPKTDEEQIFKILNIIILFIFILEFALKVMARGLKWSNPFSCLRISWSWLDIFVIVVGFSSLAYPSHRTLFAANAFRALKLIPLIPTWLSGYDRIIKKLWVRLLRLAYFSAVILAILALLGTDFYATLLRSKCVPSDKAEEFLSLFGDDNSTDRDDAIAQQSYEALDTQSCGNFTWSTQCPENYTCVNAGANPQNGLVSFDNFTMSELTLLNLIFQDFPEFVYDRIWDIDGPLHLINFFVVLIMATFWIGALLYSTIAYEYVNGLEQLKVEWEGGVKEQKPEKPQNMNKPSTLFRKSKSFGQKLVDNEIFDIVITIAIIVNVIILAVDHFAAQNSDVFMKILHYIGGIVYLIYTLECFVKLVCLGWRKYWKNCWNRFDFFIVIMLFVVRICNVGRFHAFITITVLKLVPRWPALNFLFQMMKKSFSKTTRWAIGITSVILFVFATIGYFRFGPDYADKREVFPKSEIPPWNMTTFWNSLLLQFRSFSGEWMESLWDLLLISPHGPATFFMVSSGFIGNFLVTCLGIGIAITTAQALDSKSDSEDTEEKKTSLQRIFAPCCWLGNKIRSWIDRDQNEPKFEKVEQDDDAEKTLNGTETETPTKAEKDAELPAKNDSESIPIQKKMFNHWGYKLFSCLLIIVLSALAIWWYFPPEIVFVVYFTLEVVATIVINGLNREVLTVGLVFDVLMILNSILALALDSHHGIAYLGSFRLLMLISRIGPLDRVACQLGHQLCYLSTYLLATLFIWVAFDLFGMQLYMGTFFQCSDAPDSGKEDCKNGSWVNADINFDNLPNGLWTLLFVALRNGWLNVMTSAVDSIDIDKAPEKEHNLVHTLYFATFLIFGVLFPFFSMFGVILHNLQKKSWLEILGVTEKEPETKQKQEVSASPLQKYVGNKYFEIWVAITIVADCVAHAALTFTTDPAKLTGIAIFRHCILGLYIIEAILRVAFQKKAFFKCGLNILLLLSIIFSIAEIIWLEVGENVIAISSIRVLRLFHLLALDSVCSCVFIEINAFRNAFAKSRLAIFYLFAFYLLFYGSYAIFGWASFSDVEDFSSWNSVTTLFKVATISGFDGIYNSIAKEGECNEDYSDCGHPYLGAAYLASFLAITLLVTVNIYLVVIMQTVQEIGQIEQERAKEDDNTKETEEEEDEIKNEEEQTAEA